MNPEWYLVSCKHGAVMTQVKAVFLDICVVKDLSPKTILYLIVSILALIENKVIYQRLLRRKIASKNA